MRIRFIVCQGSGNDFPLVDARDVELDDEAWAGIARGLADRAGPVGGDGLLLFTKGDAHHQFGMRMFNSDGSEAETCLNGLRCVARAGFEALGIDRATVRLKTSSAEVARDEEIAPGIVTIREVAGPAELDVGRWLVTGEHENVQRPIEGLPSGRAFTAVAMPNPHLVSFVDAIDEGELVAIGRFAETAPPLLPERANVSFVEMRGPDTLFVRTFERGVGLTDSCGSAMAASTFASALAGRTDFGREITVLNRGGLVRGQAEADGMVRLSGNATWDWAGSAEVDPVRGIAGAVEVERHHNSEIAAWAVVADRTII